MGVYDPDLTEPLARVLGLLGSTRAFVVHGLLGLDEWSTAGVTRVSELRDGEVTTSHYTARDLGLPEATPEQLQGGTPAENAQLIYRIFRGEEGPRRDIVLVNAAAALVGDEHRVRYARRPATRGHRPRLRRRHAKTASPPRNDPGLGRHTGLMVKNHPQYH